MCCPTPPITVDQCRAGPVISTKYVQAVRTNCPSAYSFAYDDTQGLVSIHNFFIVKRQVNLVSNL